MRAQAEASLDLEVRLAARAMARHGLAHAYGHVSARVDEAHFVVTPPHPLGRVRLDTPLLMCAVDAELPEGALPEVRMHQEIYLSRADVGGICRFQSHSVIALSAIRRTPRLLHGLGCYFAPGAPLWDDPMLVRDQERASGVARTLASGSAVVLRGNGAVVVGASAREAACHAFFLEDAARVELAVLATRESATSYTIDQAQRRCSSGKHLYDRMWEFLVGDDFHPPEVRS